MADGGRSAHGDYERSSLSPAPPPMSSSKRKFEDPVETGRRSGLSDGGQRPSYKSVPPPLSDFELAKQRAEQIAARLVGTELKRARTSADDSDGVVGSNVEQGHSHGYGHVAADERPAPDYYSQQPPLQTRKVDVPNSKVGLVIGKGGETIRTLQQQSGAKIQVTRDAETDPNSTTRQVELTGTPEQISRAEQLIRDVVGDQGAPTGGPPVGSVPGVGEQMQIRVPNNKVGLIIGKGGETIRNLQNSSGCRIQVQHDRETEPGAMERVVTLLGTKQQTDMATEMIKDVIGEGRSRGPSAHGGYQQGFRPGPPQPWGPPPSMQQPGYGYQQGYAGAPQQYGGYSGWDQPPPVPGQQPAQQGSYDYYQQNQTSEGSQQNNTDGNYSYGQQGYYGGYDQQGYGQESQAYDQQAYGQQQGYDQAYNQQEQDYSGGGYGYEYDQSYSYDQSAQYPQAEGAPPSEYDYPQPPASSAAQTAQS